MHQNFKTIKTEPAANYSGMIETGSCLNHNCLNHNCLNLDYLNRDFDKIYKIIRMFFNLDNLVNLNPFCSPLSRKQVYINGIHFLKL